MFGKITKRGSDEVAREAPAQPAVHQGNWYVLLMGLPRLGKPLTLASGLTLVPLESPLTVFDLAAAGAVGFREWALLEAASRSCTCEIETARDSDVLPGYDTLNRAWLASVLLVLRGFSQHLGVACSSYSWNLIAGHQSRSGQSFKHQAARVSKRLSITQISIFRHSVGTSWIFTRN